MLPIAATNLPTLAASASPAQTGAVSEPVRLPHVAPTLRQTGYGLPATEAFEASVPYSAKHPKVQIYHPASAPSAQVTENVLMAKALLSQPFAHSGAATKIARISNMFQDAPRFGNAVNILS